MSDPLTPLVVAGISMSFRGGGTTTKALDGVSLSVDAGEIVALLGNNGAGKSTLMSICAGLIAADSGEVFVEGECVTEGGGRPSSQLGLAPQEEALYPTLTVRQNLHYFGRLAGLKGSELGGRIDEVARHLMVHDLLDRKARDLSGGQRRRLHTGLALMHRPTVLLLDEPTVGIDIDARAELLDFVRSTVTSGAAILYSTHQLHEVESLGARVVIIDRGRVLASGSVDDLVAAHAPPVAELRFDRADAPLPSGLLDTVDEAGTTPTGEFRVVVRLQDPDTHVTQILDRLEPDARASLLAASIVAPSLEQAYLRITRGVSGADGAPSTGMVVTGRTQP